MLTGALGLSRFGVPPPLGSAWADGPEASSEASSDITQDDHLVTADGVVIVAGVAIPAQGHHFLFATGASSIDGGMIAAEDDDELLGLAARPLIEHYVITY